MGRMTGFVMAAVLGAAACETLPEAGGTGPEEAIDPSRAILTEEACPDMGAGGYFFWMKAYAVEPGQVVQLFPYFTSMPGMIEAVEPGCLDNVTLSPDGMASLSRDESGVPYLTIEPEAGLGETLYVTAAYRETGMVSGRIEIFSSLANPLVGTWRQAAEDCPTSAAVRELVFTAGGEFSVTWTPFEVYKDYWGAYNYDVVTGKLAFDVDGGNQVPDDIVPSGTARVEDDLLVLDGILLGTPRQAEAGCRAPFHR